MKSHTHEDTLHRPLLLQPTVDDIERSSDPTVTVLYIMRLFIAISQWPPSVCVCWLVYYTLMSCRIRLHDQSYFLSDLFKVHSFPSVWNNADIIMVWKFNRSFSYTCYVCAFSFFFVLFLCFFIYIYIYTAKWAIASLLCSFDVKSALRDCGGILRKRTWITTRSHIEKEMNRDLI